MNPSTHWRDTNEPGGCAPNAVQPPAAGGTRKRRVPIPLVILFVTFVVALALVAFPHAFTKKRVARNLDVPRVIMPLMARAPTIDGRVDELEWRSAVRNVGLVSNTTNALTTRPGIFWIGSDGQQLFVAMKTEAPPDGRILTRAVPDPTLDANAVLHDDAWELVLDPWRGRRQGNNQYFHIIANARGGLLDWSVDPDNRHTPIDLGWRVSKWDMAQQVVDGWWNVEFAVSLEGLGVGRQDLAQTWGLRLARDWKQPYELSQWSSRAGSYDAQSSMAQVAWHPDAPVVRVLSLQDSTGKPSVKVAVFNPHDKLLTVRVHLSDVRAGDSPKDLDRRIDVGPNQEATVELEALDGGPDDPRDSLIDVASPDGASVYYHRAFRWSVHRPTERWVIGRLSNGAVDLQFKYYPYHDQIGYRVDTGSLARPDRANTAEAAVWRADANGNRVGEPIARETIRFTQSLSEGVMDIPKLAGGDYVFGVSIPRDGGSSDLMVTRSFVRRAFEWENNQLGDRDEVMPPFTPLKVEGSTVRSVLREHRHGSSGVWDQVTSDGRTLLAGPMRWEVVTRSTTTSVQQRVPVVGTGWKTASLKQTAVSGEADWSAGPVLAHVTTEYDYDGMMLVRLALEPESAPIERLSLVVPLDAAVGRYMHAVGDGLRHNYAGFVPEGEGRVWDSSKAARLEIVGPFFPYLWVGDGERGLSWFADTDRDWVLDERTPAVELVREGSVLTMRVNFITRPGPLTRRHEIVFGIQATPTKPMPEGWRRWVASKQVAGGRPVRWMGATYSWGGVSFDLYPFGNQLEFFDELKEARESGQVDRAFVDRWMNGIDARLAPKASERYRMLQRHVQSGFQVASTARWNAGFRLFGYTNPRGVGFAVPEFATFQDEWLRSRWFNRNWTPEGESAYDVSPSRSFQDYALWYYRRMQTCFDGVYWDNMYLSADFDPVTGQAWVDEQGRTHPSMGLMQLRALVKRTAVMLWQDSKAFPETRRPPVTLGHMTNALVVPVLSFSNATMDWEWKYGADDFQDRFSPDLTVAESVGRQVGAWPTILPGGNLGAGDPRADFMWRTRLGVALVHELQVFDYRPQRDADVYKKLFDFGYGLPDCLVFNYWRDEYPVQVEGVDARTLAMARGGAAIIVVTDYGGGGTCRLMLDRQKLGLRSLVTATDLETGATLGRAADGKFVFPLKKHDFRILRVK